MWRARGDVNGDWAMWGEGEKGEGLRGWGLNENAPR